MRLTIDLAAWDDLTTRIYADRDFSPGGREVALTLAWALHHPAADGEEGNPWRRASAMLGRDPVYSTRRIDEAAAEDLPRYDSPIRHQLNGECEGPRTRAYRPRTDPDRTTRHTCYIGHHPHVGDCQFTIIHATTVQDFLPDRPRDPAVCGAYATIGVTEYDPVTGWEANRWFCTRHKDRAREVKAQLRAALPEPPPPVPNRGGILPRYFACDWAAVYAHVAESAYGHGRACGWKPPYHGVCRDDWPIPGQTAIPRRPRLAVVAS